MEIPSLEMVLFGAKLLVWKIDIFMCLMPRLASPICMRFVSFYDETLESLFGGSNSNCVIKMLISEFPRSDFSKARAIVYKFNFVSFLSRQ